jgi:hypothetical protein
MLMVYRNANFITMANTILSKLMYVDIIRDKVMDQVAPIDVVNFVIGTGIRFSKKDMERYKSIFKYIIPNRRWLQTKLRQNYTFTVMGTDLHMLPDPITNELGTRFWRNFMYPPTTQSRYMYLIMIIAKDGHTVPCTVEFLDGSGVSNRRRDRGWPKTYFMSRDEDLPPMLTLPVNVMGVPIVLTCVTDTVATNEHLWLDPSLFVYGYMHGQKIKEQIEYVNASLDKKECIHTVKVLTLYPDGIEGLDSVESLSKSTKGLVIAFRDSYPGLPASDGMIIDL